MNLCLLLAPLVAVLMGAASIAGERDRGTLEHLLAQPLSRTGLLLGEARRPAGGADARDARGLPARRACCSSSAARRRHARALPAVPRDRRRSPAPRWPASGCSISVSRRSAVQAQGAAVFAWFGFVLLYDLVLIGCALGQRHAGGVARPRWSPTPSTPRACWACWRSNRTSTCWDRRAPTSRHDSRAVGPQPSCSLRSSSGRRLRWSSQ